jgi:glycosyltransferase involved in cell wall biosynthesis
VLLVVGGMGWKNDEILRKIEVMNEQNIVVVRPKTFVPDEDLPALMCGSIALVHPALYEGFGIAPLQAMACGKPVLVGSNSSIPEVVGDAGEYVDVRDPEMLASAMEKILQNKSQVNIKGIARAKQFTWKQTLVPLKSAIRECSEDI